MQGKLDAIFEGQKLERKMRKETRTCWALFHPKGYIHSYQDTGRLAVFGDRHTAEDKNSEYGYKYLIVEVKIGKADIQEGK